MPLPTFFHRHPASRVFGLINRWCVIYPALTKTCILSKPICLDRITIFNHVFDALDRHIIAPFHDDSLDVSVITMATLLRLNISNPTIFSTDMLDHGYFNLTLGYLDIDTNSYRLA